MKMKIISAFLLIASCLVQLSLAYRSSGRISSSVFARVRGHASSTAVRAEAWSASDAAKLGLGGEYKIKAGPEANAGALVLTDLDELEAAEPEKGSGVEKYMETAIIMIGKCPTAELRRLIQKYQPDSMPAEKADVEEHAQTAFAATWAAAGDWDKLIDLLSFELRDELVQANASINDCVESCNTMSENKIKQLIIKWDSKGALPKLNKKNYKGKFLKGDYIAVLMDILREDYGNDYTKVAGVLRKEKVDKKGFAS